MSRAIRSSGNHPRRPVRSFVRRAGRMTEAQRRALGELWPRYGINFRGEPVDLNAAFGRSAPRILEIGFGNGATLVAQAGLDPAGDYLGIEVHEPGVGHCLIAARDAAIDNLRVIVHDAIEVLETGIGDQALARVNLYFPDPWPKKRHHKRRIVTPVFLELCATRLERGGSLNIATDWAGYAEHIDEVIAASPQFACAERREHAGDRPLDRPVTKFERRGLREGHRIVDWRLEKP